MASGETEWRPVQQSHVLRASVVPASYGEEADTYFRAFFLFFISDGQISSSFPSTVADRSDLVLCAVHRNPARV